MTQVTLDKETTRQSVEKLPVKTDIFYAMITLGSTVIWSMVSGWLLYFYLAPEGKGKVLVPATLYGTVIFITRIVNALIAPSIGYLSDHTNSKWGRRLPFMFVSALPLLIFFALLWKPPVNGLSIWNLVYLSLVLLCYNLAYSANQVTYMALLPEIAQTDHHRVRISAWSSSFLLIGMIVGGLAGPIIEKWGYARTGLLYAIGMLPFFYLPFLVLREQKIQPAPTSKRTHLLEDIQSTLQNPAFRIMTATGIFYWSTTTFVQSVIPYIVTEVCQLSVADTMYFYIPGVLASLICYPIVTWLAKKHGKWAVFAGSLLSTALVLPGLLLIGDWIPIPLKTQGILWVTLQAIAMSGVTMLPAAFGAEIATYDTKLTGQHREGVYYATWGLLDQVINGVAASLLPLLLLLGRSQSDPHGPLGVRLIGVLGSVFMFLGFLIFLKYPLKKPSDTQEEINEH